jgi:hypothetical protein
MGLRQILIALGLVAVCLIILTAMKAYGVWVISGIAVVLFVLGFLRKEKAAGDSGGEVKPGPDGRDRDS